MSFVMSAVIVLACFGADAAIPDDAAVQADYAQFRQALDGSAERHAELAQRCLQWGFNDRARAHFFTAARLAKHPNDRRLLRRAAGDVHVRGRWLSPRESARLTRLESERAIGWETHGQSAIQLRAILEQFSDGSKAIVERVNARQKLAHLASIRMGWLVTAVFINSEPSASRAAVEALSTMSTVDSSESLARFAIDSPWSSVRILANLSLSNRNPRHYVHVWMDRLKTPAVFQNLELADGVTQVASVWTYETETEDVRQRYIHSSSVRTKFIQLDGQVAQAIAGERLVNRNLAGQFIPSRRAFTNTFAYITKRERTSSELANRELKQRFEGAASEIESNNSRIFEALGATAWTEIPTDVTANQSWSWWRSYNGLAPPTSSESKQLIEVVEEEEEVVVRIPVSVQVGRVHSCFAAGTPVWTDLGPVPIEMIQTGDRVLSADLDTGKLSYTVVLYPTQRQTNEKYDLMFAEETIQASASHPFWSINAGWMAAKNLHSGHQFKTAESITVLNQTKRLTETDPTMSDPVYNLVVDESHTYFVGDSMLLVHDDTIPRPRDAKDVTNFQVVN